MSRSVARRLFLTRSVQSAAAAAVVVATTRDHVAQASTEGPAQLVWDSGLRAWPPRPARAGARVVFVSTDDEAAPQPTDFDLLAGDVWWRHRASPHVVGTGRAA